MSDRFLGAPDPSVKSRQQVDEPRLYRVLLHNDDYTTMDFVVEVLVRVFHKKAAEATRIMLDVHKRGQGVAGIYSHDIAVTKVTQVAHMAREREFPLRCSCEEA